MDPLCRSRIFKDVPEYDEIKEDRYIKEKFASVFTGMSGRWTRMRILCAITEFPANTQQLADMLKLDYKTIKHNIEVLEKNGFISRTGEGYGDIFAPTEMIKSNLPTLYKVIYEAEKRLERLDKKYID